MRRAKLYTALFAECIVCGAEWQPLWRVNKPGDNEAVVECVRCLATQWSNSWQIASVKMRWRARLS